jgi:hypothetical protein
MAEINLTEEKLINIREKISDLFKKGTQAWCIGCGASAKALKELLGDPEKFREVISEDVITTSLASIKVDELAKLSDWCIGCGAGASAIRDMVSNPAQLDSLMNEISRILKIK